MSSQPKSFSNSVGGFGNQPNETHRPNRQNNLWQRVSKIRRKGQDHNEKGPQPVGTEAVALKQMKKNARVFNYPKEGFETPIEYSLLYAMISQPTGMYPNEIIEKEIQDDDLYAYLLVNTFKEDEEPPISYAQLSALLSRSAEKNSRESKDRKDRKQRNNDTNNQKNIPEILVKHVLKIVVQHAEKNGLDRESEVKELFEPVEKYANLRGEREALKSIFPLYVGYAASLATGNPLPLIFGFAVGNSMPDKMAGERQNVENFEKQSNRASNIEKASLLDEAEHYE